MDWFGEVVLGLVEEVVDDGDGAVVQHFPHLLPHGGIRQILQHLVTVVNLVRDNLHHLIFLDPWIDKVFSFVVVVRARNDIRRFESLR